MILRHFTIPQISVFLIACWGITGTARAQDFKVYTPVFDLAATETSPRAGQRPQPPIVARSVCYFHAGKAYDHVEAEQADQQVLIYEPNAQRFTVLHTSRGMATTISFEEIEQMVHDAEVKAQNYVLRAREKNLDPTRINMIAFQLEPSFKETFDPHRNTLTLKSDHMNYQVKCEATDSPERVQSYLKYCDWMARLNFVLHPQAPLPGPRLTLNGRLTDHKVIPMEVTLRAAIGGGINLKAEHKYTWQLDPNDRERIHQWQTLLQSEDTQHVPFNRFREIQLAEKR